jgi:ligand-binding SRPBCC domain-containing protein
MSGPADKLPEIARLPGGTYLLTMSTVVRRGRAEVFDALSDVRNVDRITPPWVKFRILTPMPVEMRQGAIFDYALRIRCLPAKWRTEITEWSPPNAFTDTQTSGPFDAWRDRHTFTEVDSSATLVENEIVYRVPGGSLVHRLLVRRDLLRIYQHEQRMMHELLEA